MPPPYRLKTISQFHRFRGLRPPAHPLLSVIDVTTTHVPSAAEPSRLVFDFYAIALKSVTTGQLRYGQQLFDFDSGRLGCSAPGQVIGVELEADQPLEQSGWMLLVHPDFLWHTPLAKKIKQYDFFDYAVHEALFVSEEEMTLLTTLFQTIRQETHRAIDHFSQDIIIAQLEVLLAYANRFYQRQFITRQKANHAVLDQLNQVLEHYFDGEAALNHGLPTVTFLAEQLHVSPRYLSGLLSSLTGLNTQQHIQHKLMEKAKELLSTTSLTVSEIAYALGFAQLQSFSKLFKAKTSLSPLAFRQSFN